MGMKDYGDMYIGPEGKEIADKWWAFFLANR